MTNPGCRPQDPGHRNSKAAGRVGCSWWGHPTQLPIANATSGSASGRVKSQDGKQIPGDKTPLLNRARQRFHFQRLPERSRRNRQPHVEASQTPTANAIAKPVRRLSGHAGHPEVCQAAFWPSVALRQPGSGATAATKAPWRIPAGDEDKAQRWQSGSSRRGDRRHAGATNGGLGGTVWLERSTSENQSVESTASMRRGRSPGSKQGLDVRGFERSAAIYSPQAAYMGGSMGNSLGVEVDQ
jgi:hypothetical protein